MNYDKSAHKRDKSSLLNNWRDCGVSVINHWSSNSMVNSRGGSSRQTPTRPTKLMMPNSKPTPAPPRLALPTPFKNHNPISSSLMPQFNANNQSHPRNHTNPKTVRNSKTENRALNVARNQSFGNQQPLNSNSLSATSSFISSLKPYFPAKSLGNSLVQANASPKIDPVSRNTIDYAQISPFDEQQHTPNRDPQQFELHVTNLDYKISIDEWRRILSEVLKSCRVSSTEN